MKERKIITLGGAGDHICRALLSQGVDPELISHFSTDPVALQYLDLKDKFLVGDVAGRICNYEVTKELFDNHCDLFEHVIEPDVLYALSLGVSIDGKKE